jgi:threonine/homoserine/homoserine lactone efflux protein
MALVFPSYIQGFLYSFVFLLATGPSFFYMISLSIKKGFKSGALFALGIIISDIFIVAIVFFGLGELLETYLFKLLFSLIGGLVLVVLALKFIFEKIVDKPSGKEEEVSGNMFSNSMKGFLMNISNPFAFFVWLTLHTSLIHSHPEYTEKDTFYFLIGLFTSLLAMEVSKAFLADKIGKLLTYNILKKVHKALGILFLCIGVWLIYTFVQLLIK